MPTGQDPPCFVYLWHWFNELTDWREQGFGVGPVSHQEIIAWATLNRFKPQPCEVSVLRALDRVFRKYHNDKNDPSGGASSSSPVSSREMTPELFDSLFG